jgi:lysophospholipase L1-like esterase
VDASNFRTWVAFDSVSLTNGQSFTLSGLRQGDELMRVDYIEFNFAGPDVFAPTATAIAPDVTIDSSSNSTYQFSVTYSDETEVDVSTLGNSDIRVTGPNSFDQLANLVAIESSPNSSKVVASYEILVPGGNWDTSDVGLYLVSSEPNQVADGSGNFLDSLTLDTFRVLEATSNSRTLNYSSSEKSVLVRLDKGFTVEQDNNQPLKIMPLGDSITRGEDGSKSPTRDLSTQEGYREDLWDALQDLGLFVDFVGSQSNGPDTLEDKNHQGHGGKGIGWMRNNINTFLNDARPDVILLMIGTNDGGSNGATIAGNLGDLIGDILSNSSFSGQLLVSTVPPAHSKGDYSSRGSNLAYYNTLIEQEVLSFNSDRVSFFDIGGQLNETDHLASPTIDNGLHPNQEGYRLIAQGWYDALVESIGKTETFDNVNNIVGSNYDDMLFGNGANNLIEGGMGEDTLTGNGGTDTFAYNTIYDFGDTIKDFDSDDQIQLLASGFGGSLNAGFDLSQAGSGAILISGSNPSAGSTQSTFLYDTVSGILSLDQDGTGMDAPLKVATFEGVPSLAAEQIILA